jgi:hypothetical protein
MSWFVNSKCRFLADAQRAALSASCRFSALSCQISDKIAKSDKANCLIARQLHLALVVRSAFSVFNVFFHDKFCK